MELNKGAVPYQDEIINALEEIRQENPSIQHLDYFIGRTYWYFKENKKKVISPKVVIIGTSIPEEIFFAAGITPYWILGGSLCMTEHSSELTPRDTDPVSRSVLGYIESQKVADFSQSLFIIPSSSDSMRKIAYQLKTEGKKIYMVDIPPQKEDPMVWSKCAEVMNELCETICNHTGRNFSRRKYNAAADMVDEARLQLARFLKRTRLYPGIVSSRARMLVQNSYYYSGRLNEWSRELEKLNDEIKKLSGFASRISNTRELFEDTCDLKKIICEKTTPKVLLVGSPIYFPNYKVPKLIEDAGLELCEMIDSSTQKLKRKTYKAEGKRKKELIFGLARSWYRNDCSSAFVINHSLLENLKKSIDNLKPNGVICHVLKGQIEYDFELQRMEKTLEEMDIPVFRLETDYKYNDIEQLRIRMEAFSEMLSNRSLCIK